MTDTRDAAIASFAGMQSSIRSMRYLTMILAGIDQDRSVVRNGDGTAYLVFDSIDELNAQGFLILQIEEKMQAMVKEFDGCIEVWAGGKGASREASNG